MAFIADRVHACLQVEVTLKSHLRYRRINLKFKSQAAPYMCIAQHCQDNESLKGLFIAYRLDGVS